jgi:hypothetical protein
MKNAFLSGLLALSLVVAILPVEASANTMYHRYYTYNTTYPTAYQTYPVYDNTAQINALLAQIRLLQVELDRIQATQGNQFCNGSYCTGYVNPHNNGYYNGDVARSIDVVFKNSAAYITINYQNGRSEDFIAGGARTTDDVVDFLVRSTTLSDANIRSMLSSRNDYNNGTHYSRGSNINDILVTIDQNNNSATARVRYNDGTSQRYNYDSSSQSTIENNLASDLNMSRSDVTDLITFDYTNSYGNSSSRSLSSIDVFWNANDDATVNVYFSNSGTANYHYYNSPSQSDIVTRLADSLGVSESQIRNVISFH